MPKYRVLRGTYRREDGTRAEPGDVIDISEETRQHIAGESLERIDTDEQATAPDGANVAPTPAEQAGDDTADTDSDAADETDEVESEADVAPSLDEVEESEASGDLPDDWELLQAMAVVYEGDEVKGNSSEEAIRDHFSEFSDTEIAILKDKAEDHLYAEPDDAE